MDKYAIQAMEECIGDTKTTRRGGVDGKPFWNINSSQFMYVPSLLFPSLARTKEYIFTATDSKGRVYSFKSNRSTAPLTPIWKDLASGIVELKVEAVQEVTGDVYLIGARSFCKMSPFPGREALPEKACSYKDCALKAFRFVFNDEITRYWLTHGIPKPDYYHNVYPSKIISSIIRAMIAYAKLEPGNAEEALKIATNAADYLISITYGEDTALSGLPPTYSFKGLDKEIVDKNAPAADGRQHLLMTIYPATVGSAYLELEEATGDKKYFNAAMKIAEYYRKNVLDDGSWFLLVSAETGKPEVQNHCGNFSVLDFLTKIHERTGNPCWRQLEQNYFSHLDKTHLQNYNWEAQFEDSILSVNYSNLSHIDADKMICYIADNLSHNLHMTETAEELMRYVEDQFVVWDEFAPWNPFRDKNEKWYSPAAMEQYRWYVPIDGSTANVTMAFLKLYTITNDELYREKAFALGDSITRMQNPENGVIPTHWTTTDCRTKLENFWINCHIGTAFVMLELAKANGEI